MMCSYIHTLLETTCRQLLNLTMFELWQMFTNWLHAFSVTPHSFNFMTFAISYKWCCSNYRTTIQYCDAQPCPGPGEWWRHGLGRKGWRWPWSFRMYSGGKSRVFSPNLNHVSPKEHGLSLSPPVRLWGTGAGFCFKLATLVVMGGGSLLRLNPQLLGEGLPMGSSSASLPRTIKELLLHC